MRAIVLSAFFFLYIPSQAVDLLVSLNYHHIRGAHTKVLSQSQGYTQSKQYQQAHSRTTQARRDPRRQRHCKEQVTHRVPSPTSVSPLSKRISVLLFIWTTLVGVTKEGLVCLLSILTTVIQFVVFIVAADLVSIVFALLELAVFVLRWALNKAAIRSLS